MTIDEAITGVVLESQMVRGASEALLAEAGDLLRITHVTDADADRQRRLANADADLRAARDRIDAVLAKLATLPPGVRP